MYCVEDRTKRILLYLVFIVDSFPFLVLEFQLNLSEKSFDNFVHTFASMPTSSSNILD